MVSITFMAFIIVGGYTKQHLESRVFVAKRDKSWCWIVLTMNQTDKLAKVA